MINQPYSFSVGIFNNPNWEPSEEEEEEKEKKESKIRKLTEWQKKKKDFKCTNEKL